MPPRGPCAAGCGAGDTDRHSRDADQRRRAFRARIRGDSVDFIQPDAPRVGGMTGFLKICALAHHKRLRLAPHFAMEIHLHLLAAYAHEPWVEHFEWLEPLFNERLEIRDGRMIVRTAPVSASASANRPPPGRRIRPNSANVHNGEPMPAPGLGGKELRTGERGTRSCRALSSPPHTSCQKE